MSDGGERIRNLQALMRWSASQGSGFEPTDEAVPEMDAERREFLSHVLVSLSEDFVTRMTVRMIWHDADVDCLSAYTPCRLAP